MITCNRCGKQVQAGLANCPNCGMSLSSGNQGGPNLKRGASEQAELPAWLESLRTSERPGTNTTSAPGYSSPDLIDEGALPGWMRPENTDMADNFSGRFPAVRPSSLPGPNTDGTPPTGITASSLIDERSLPSWLQESSTTGPNPQQGNFSAASLIQPDALPDWMKNLQSPPSPSAPRVEPTIPQQGIAARNLLDQQSLPPWLTGQANLSNLPNQSPTYNSAPRSGQAGLAGSSLLDMNALPNWLQESGQARMNQEHPRGEGVPPSQPGQNSMNNSNLAAASLIDMNALPGWLRSNEEQRQGGMPGQVSPSQEFSGGSQAPGHANQVGFNTPPRVENIRVPSRPRGEVGPQEQSEVAANIFSSMLGVASSAPYFPAQSPNAPASQGGSGNQQYFQGNQPQAQPMSSPGSNPSWSNAPGTMVQPQTQQAYPPGSIPPSGNAGGPSSPGYMPGGYQGGYPTSGQPGASPHPPTITPGMQPVQATDNQKRNAQSSGSSPAKRGIIETIRSWFTR